jgi:hypothetical protein
MKKVICITLAYLMLLVPIIAQQQTDACMQASIDAENKIDGNLWFGAGCLFGLLGLGAAYVIEPSPSAIKLMGKDAEYVAIYTDCYKEAGKNIQTSKAMYGCLIGTGISAVLYAVLIAAAASADDEYYY